MSHLLRNLLVFGRMLRSAGLDVHPGRMLDVAEALPSIDLGARDEVYHACRTLLVHRHEDLAPFDRVFDAFWTGTSTGAIHRRPRPDVDPPATHGRAKGASRGQRRGPGRPISVSR